MIGPGAPSSLSSAPPVMPGISCAVDDRRAVKHDRDAPADELDVERLPLAGRARRIDGRRDEAVDAAHAQRIERLAGVVLDLHLVAAAQIHAAVAAGRKPELGVQPKVAERRVRDEIDARRRRGQHVALHAPAARVLRAARRPAREVAAVQQSGGAARHLGLAAARAPARASP